MARISYNINLIFFFFRVIIFFDRIAVLIIKCFDSLFIVIFFLFVDDNLNVLLFIINFF